MAALLVVVVVAGVALVRWCVELGRGGGGS